MAVAGEASVGVDTVRVGAAHTRCAGTLIDVHAERALRFEPVPTDAGGSVDAGGIVGAVKVRGADCADVGGLAGEAAIPVVADRAVAAVSGALVDADCADAARVERP